MTVSKNTAKVPASTSEWDVVSEPRSTVVLDTIGDEWEGFFEGFETIRNERDGEDMEYINFRDSSGEAFHISAGYDLTRAFQGIPQGTYSKIILVNLVERNKGNALKLHKVLTRR